MILECTEQGQTKVTDTFNKSVVNFDQIKASDRRELIIYKLVSSLVHNMTRNAKERKSYIFSTALKQKFSRLRLIYKF